MSTSISLRQLRRDSLRAFLRSSDPGCGARTTRELRERLHGWHPAQLELALVELIEAGEIGLVHDPSGDHGIELLAPEQETAA